MRVRRDRAQRRSLRALSRRVSPCHNLGQVLASGRLSGSLGPRMHCLNKVQGTKAPHACCSYMGNRLYDARSSLHRVAVPPFERFWAFALIAARI